MLLNDDSVVDPGYVERIAAALDPAGGVVMAAGVMRDARLARADRDGRNRARPDAARLRLPERRARCGPRWARSPDPRRPIGGRRRLRPRGVPLGRGLRRADLRLPRGRGSGPAAAAGRRSLPAGAETRRASHEHSATLGAGLGPQGLPGRVRSRLSAPEVERALAAAGCRGCWFGRFGQATIQSVVDRNLGPMRGRVNGLRAGSAHRALSAAGGARRPAVAWRHGGAPRGAGARGSGAGATERPRPPASSRSRA